MKFERYRIALEGAVQGGMLNDLATCADCLSEIMDPTNRRHGYPFTNCAACGPRFTIVERLPYDRGATTMHWFEMCDACRAEYETPSDRRYQAQPNGCRHCGPALSHSIADIVRALRAGSIVALKGLGGFHLLCDARNGVAVARLRRKARDYKPFAVMMPSLAAARQYCEIDEKEAAALTSRAAPIVLLRPRHSSDLAPNVSGRAPFIGALLPYSPLHHLLMHDYRAPIVATSGNVAGQPIAIDDDEVRTRLGSIADLTVTHDRPIARPCDDSVVRVGANGPSILRRARGYAPLPINVGVDMPAALAVGGHRKNTIAISMGRHALVSQHLGDLDSAPALRGFEAAIDDLCRMYHFTPDVAVVDRHPDYASRRWAESSGLPIIEVQHHHAHVAACAAENGLRGRYLGVAWDGGGRGDDDLIWGGEFFAVEGARFNRIAHLRPMRGVNSPWCTSVERLFDAVASAIGVCKANRFEDEAVLALEAATDRTATGSYPFGEELTGDWKPLIAAIRHELDAAVPVATIATRFHRTLVDWICRVAAHAQIGPVVLSGSVFQNAFLVDSAIASLTARGHTVLTHRLVPADDGGLSLGQLVLARHALAL